MGKAAARGGVLGSHNETVQANLANKGFRKQDSWVHGQVVGGGLLRTYNPETKVAFAAIADGLAGEGSGVPIGDSYNLAMKKHT